jgi:hypothetical protein
LLRGPGWVERIGGGNFGSEGRNDNRKSALLKSARCLIEKDTETA